MTVASDYLGARYVQANPFVVVGAEKLIETVLLSLGITVAFSSDLKTLAKRLSYNIDEWTADEQACIQEMIDSGKVKINDSAVGKTWAKLKSKVKGIVVPNDKSATKPKVPDILDTSVSMQFQYGILSESQLFSVWNNLDVVSEDNSDVVAKGVYDEVLNNGFCMVGKKKSLKRCLKKRMILLLGFLMMTGVAVAQQLQVQGKVTDEIGRAHV